MLELILEDRHVTYRDIETTSILHKNLDFKKLVISVSHTICQSPKSFFVEWTKKMLTKYDRGASEHVYDIVTDDGFKTNRYFRLFLFVFFLLFRNIQFPR